MPAVLTLLACALPGTAGWYFPGVATGYNCGMSGAGCGTTAKLRLAAGGIGVWLPAGTAAVLLHASRARPGLRRPATIACWVLLPQAEPGGVSCTTSMVWLGLMSWSRWKPTRRV